MKSWGQQAEEEAIDRVYYEALDLQESTDKLRNANMGLMQENLKLRQLLEDGRRVVGEYMGAEQEHTYQREHLAKQALRLHKENEEWKTSHATLMELNKSCAQSNVDLHEQFEVLKYKSKTDHDSLAKTLTAWINANGVLTKEKESLKQMVEHLRARNVDLEKKVGNLNCIANGGFACGGCVSCLLDKAEKNVDTLTRQLSKLQISDTAHRKIIDFHNTAEQILTKTLCTLQDLPMFAWKQKRTVIINCHHSVQAIQANIDHEFEELEKNQTVKVKI